MGESFRRNAPKEMQCSMFCGGRRCKYEQGSSWKKEDMAIDGIYSHWITDDILAMARPNTAAMKKHSLVTKFKVYNFSLENAHIVVNIISTLFIIIMAQKYSYFFVKRRTRG